AGHSFKTSGESPHEALANLRDDERSQWTFYDRYGAVHTKKELVDPKQWSEILRAEPFKNLPSPELMAQLIKLGVPADVDQQFKKFVSAQETGAAVARAAGQPCPYVDLELRDLLRRAWRWDIASLDKIEQVACQNMKLTWH